MSGAWQLWARQRPAWLWPSVERWHLIEGFARGDGSPLVRTACARELHGRGARISDRQPNEAALMCPDCLRTVPADPAPGAADLAL